MSHINKGLSFSSLAAAKERLPDVGCQVLSGDLSRASATYYARNSYRFRFFFFLASAQEQTMSTAWPFTKKEQRLLLCIPSARLNMVVPPSRPRLLAPGTPR